MSDDQRKNTLRNQLVQKFLRQDSAAVSGAVNDLLETAQGKQFLWWLLAKLEYGARHILSELPEDRVIILAKQQVAYDLIAEIEHADETTLPHFLAGMAVRNKRRELELSAYDSDRGGDNLRRHRERYPSPGGSYDHTEHWGGEGDDEGGEDGDDSIGH